MVPAPAASPDAPRTLIVACGALARELVTVVRANAWHHVDIACLPAHWHNTPERIVPGVEEKILAARTTHARVLVAYGDCGTGGRLDALLERHGVERLPGAHCYAFFAGVDDFEALADPEPGTFYLTDYLAANFERLVMEDLGIRRHPALRETYFGHYTRVLHLAQGDARAPAHAEAAARALGLPLEVHRTGLEPLTDALRDIRVVAA